MKLNNNQLAFLELIRAGLWEKDACLLPYGDIDFQEIYKLAQEQAVVGLVAAGLEHVKDIRIPKEDALVFAGDALQIEQRNVAMNDFVGVIVEKLRQADIYTLLVKGQGVAQCYERPLWRASGDIDFLLSDNNYIRAKSFLTPLASHIDVELKNYCHLALRIGSWEVELHGTLRCGLWGRLDKTLDDVQKSVFCDGAVRSWMNGHKQVSLPRADEDIFFVFTHILQHFFKEGVGLRQICDWCRLLWKYGGKINIELLKSRLKSAGILSEWKVFSALAVVYLGIPKETIPFYSSKICWRKKSKRVLAFILETGNFGHNRDHSYYSKKSKIESKAISLWRHTNDAMAFLMIFPLDGIRVWCKMIEEGTKELIK